MKTSKTTSTRILVLEPAGTFGHATGIEYAKQHDLNAGFVFAKTNLEMCRALSDGHADLAIVPLENNIAGLVPDWLLWTKDELEFGTPRTQIIDESVSAISQTLMARNGVTKGNIRVILSHERALKQCAKLIAALLAANPSLKVIETTSTAEAARLVSKSDPEEGLAAIAGIGAAMLYGLQTLEESVEDNPGNVTRFAIMRSTKDETLNAQSGTHSKPSVNRQLKRVIVVFDLPHEVGALHKVTGKLLELKANMTALGVLPQGLAKRYSYSFYLEYEIDHSDVEDSIKAFRSAASRLVVLGNFSVKSD